MIRPLVAGLGSSQKRDKGAANRQRPYAEPEIVVRIKQIVEHQLGKSQTITIPQLCHHLGMSHSQLHRKLKAATGQPASKIIRAIKINKAKALLKNHNLTLTSVAFDSGFQDPDYFFRVFKLEVGMTPTQFRRKTKSFMAS